jgi:predicted anti-sigma-YlaC factor YlaD
MTGRIENRLWRRTKGLMLRNLPLMIDCGQFESFLIDYLEGKLPGRQRAVLEFHLKICRECRDYLAAYRRTIEVGKAVFADPSADLPDDVPDDLVKAVLEARKA